MSFPVAIGAIAAGPCGVLSRDKNGEVSFIPRHAIKVIMVKDGECIISTGSGEFLSVDSETGEGAEKLAVDIVSTVFGLDWNKK